MIASWPCPLAGGGATPEYALCFDRGRPARLLITPALFDEANRLRRFTVETMRALDAHGIDCFLPDLPGTNESLQPLAAQTPASWKMALAAAACHFGASHGLALRGGALAAPDLPGWQFAPIGGAAILRQLLRARVLAAREAGREESQEALLELGSSAGLELAGYALGPAMVAGLHEAQGPDRQAGPLHTISQADIGGAGLWLRAEPDESPAQSEALAALIGSLIAGAPA